MWPRRCVLDCTPAPHGAMPMGRVFFGNLLKQAKAMTNLLNKGVREPNEMAYYTDVILDEDGDEVLIWCGSPYQLHDDCTTIKL